MRVAKLDQRGHLIGERQASKPKADDVEIGDLPVDGSYKYDVKRKTFVPVNHGFGKPMRPGVDRDRAMYLLIKALVDGRPIPQECRDWAAWYERYNRT